DPPVALPPPAAVTAFQGFTTGPLTLGQFLIPHGAETGANEYTAQINWGDGSPVEAGTVTVFGTTVTVSSAGHIYTQVGAIAPGPKTAVFHPSVTLSDDTGDSDVVRATINVAPDVTKEVSVVGLGGPLNPSTGLITSSGTITSVGGLDIPGPLYLIVHGLPAGVTLANADGTVFSGDPFRTVNVSQLHPGQT